MEQKNTEKAIVLLEPYLKSTILDTIQNKKARIIDNLGLHYKDNQVLKD
jgi:hypothetical protein